MFDRLFLRRNPSSVAVPQGFEGFYCDSSGNLVKQSPTGTTKVVGALAEGAPVLAVAATGTLTGTTISVGDWITINGEYYFFDDVSGVGGTPRTVLVAGSESETLDNLIAAINGSEGAYHSDLPARTDVVASAGSGDTLVLTASVAGTTGNSITTASDLTSGTWSSATLVGGVDATPASAGEGRFDSSYPYLAITDVTINSTTGWKKTALLDL